MPMINWATAGTATVELIILNEPEGNLKKSSHIEVTGCFVKNDTNLQDLVKNFIQGPGDRNRFDPANSKYIFYSPVDDFKRDVAKVVLRYEQISKKRFTNVPEQKTKTCTVDKPLVIRFDGHFFLYCDSEDLNKSKFLEEYSKEVRIYQTLDPSKSCYGLGMEDHYLLFIPFSMGQCQSHNDIYETNDRSFKKLEEAGPLLLNDDKTVVGCYRKSNGNCRIKINVFGKSQVLSDPVPDSSPPGPPERERTPDQPPRGLTERDQTQTLPPSGPPERDQADLPSPGPQGDNRQLGAIKVSNKKVIFLYDQLILQTIRHLDNYIENGRGTLDELKDRFRGSLSQLTENERKKIDTIRKLVDALEHLRVIEAYDMDILKMLAEELKLEELKKKVEKFKAECPKAINLKTVLVTGELEDLAFAYALIRKHRANPENLENLEAFVDPGAQVLEVRRGSVVFVLEVSSISSLKRLWQSYKDGSLKEKLKKSFNEMEELKEVSQGEEIYVEVTIDEEEYREVFRDLILMEMKDRMHSSQNIKRRHSICCERDVPKDKPMDVKGKSVKDTKSQHRHSTCCERDVLEDRSQPIDATQIQTQVGQPVTEQEKSEKRIKRAIKHQDQTVRNFLYNKLKLATIRYLEDYIENGRGTLDELKARFRVFLSQITENEREDINTVQKLVKTLEDQGVIGANDVETLKMLAETLELRELIDEVDEFEKECSGDDTTSSTAIHVFSHYFCLYFLFFFFSFFFLLTFMIYFPFSLKLFMPIIFSGPKRSPSGSKTIIGV